MKRATVILGVLLFLCATCSAQQAGRPRQVGTRPGLPCNPRDFVTANDTKKTSVCNADGSDWTTLPASGVIGAGNIGGSTGSTDNAIVRADGTGGVTLQGSAAKVDDAGNVLAGDGTAAAPAFSFVSDLDTGIFHSAANLLGVAVGGGEKWDFNVSGGFNCASDGGCVIGNGAADPQSISVRSGGLTIRGATSGSSVLTPTATGGGLNVSGSVAIGAGSAITSSGAGGALGTAAFTAASAYQPIDSDLTTIAGLTATTGNLIQSVGSAWASQTPAQLVTSMVLPYDLGTQITGKPDASAVVLKFVATRSFVMSATGHQCSAGTGANAQADFIVAVNGTTKDTLRFAAAGTTCSIVGGTSVTVTAGQVVTITAPGSQDSALADIALSLFGTLP